MNEDKTSDQIVPADERQRRIALLFAIVLGIVGLVVLWVFRGMMQDIEKLGQQNLPAAAAKAMRVLTIVAWAGGLGLVGMGAWFFSLGHRVNRSGRFPPPGMKVIKDTPLRTGAKARAMANLALATAVLCVVAGTAGMWYLYQMALTLLRP